MSWPTGRLGEALVSILAHLSQGAPGGDVLREIADLLEQEFPGVMVLISLTEAGGGQRMVRDGSPQLSVRGRTPQSIAAESGRWWSSRALNQGAWDPAFWRWAREREINGGAVMPIMDGTSICSLGTVGVFWGRVPPVDEALHLALEAASHLASMVLQESRPGFEAAAETADWYSAYQGGAPLEELLTVVCESLETHLPRVCCGIAKWEAEDGRLRFVAGPHVPDGYRRRAETLPIEAMPVQQMMATGRPVMFADIAEDPAWIPLREAALRHDIRAALLWPIRSLDGRVIAAFPAYFRAPGLPTLGEWQRIERGARAVRQVLALKQLQLDRASWLGRWAHELRNPLTAMELTIDGLQRSHDDGTASLGPHLARLRTQVGLQARLVDNALDWARLKSGKWAAAHQTFSLSALVDQVVDTWQTAATEQGVRLVVQSKNDAWVFGSRDRMGEVIINLLQNALQFTPQNGLVTLTVTEFESEVELAVEDTGRGFDAETATHLFDEFWQFPAIGARQEGKLGLGLALVRQWVRECGGEVNASSAGPGLGSRFVVRLPRHREDVVMPANLAAGANDQGKRVLVVEDNPELSTLIKEALTGAGHAVTALEDARSVRDWTRSHAPADAIVCDITLPDTNGWDLLPELRGMSGWSTVPALALTGWDGPEARERSRRAGFSVHLVKPVGLAAILNWVATLHAVDA